MTLALSGEPPDRVLPSLERALAVQPRDAQAHALAAGCCIDLGNREKARQHLDIALELDPADPFVLRTKEIVSRKM